MCVSSRYDHEVARRQHDRFSHTLSPEPAGPARDDVKYCAVLSDADAPRRSELRPEVDAAPETYPPQQVSEKSFSPGIDGRQRCGSLSRRRFGYAAYDVTRQISVGDSSHTV